MEQCGSWILTAAKCATTCLTISGNARIVGGIASMASIGMIAMRMTTMRIGTRTRRIITLLNEKRVHAWLVYDLFTLGLLRCRPISQQRRTRPLASVSTRSLAVVEASTQTMNTEAH